MADRTELVKTYVTEEEYIQLKKWADETDKSLSSVVRDAVREYTDNDRAARIEDKLDRVLDSLDDEAHTHTKANTPCNTGSSSLETARDIVRRLQRNHDEVLKDDDVVLAIEDMAGVDDRTIRKYKSIFRRRGLLFEHPAEAPIWTTESDQWLDWMEDYTRLNGQEAAEEVVDEYPANVLCGVDGIRIELSEVADG